VFFVSALSAIVWNAGVFNSEVVVELGVGKRDGFVGLLVC
jgi:hypothetical protein